MLGHSFPTRRSSDLVVDAAGRSSRAGEWLKNIGVASPEETVIDPLGGYACRWFKFRSDARWPSDWWWSSGAWVWNDPLRASALVRYENGRWLLMLAGLNENYPPNKEQEFMSAPAQLSSPVIAQMLSLMEPVSSVHGHRGLINRWRHYERWRPGLRGFIAVADAACIFNPVFAQGMTVAAVSASILRNALEKGGPTNPRLENLFFASQARFQQEAWRLSVSTDVVLPGTKGPNSRALRLFQRYREAVTLAARNPSVGRRLVEVMNLLKPCSALFAPSILLRAATAQTAVTLARLSGHSLIPPATPMPPPMPEATSDA